MKLSINSSLSASRWLEHDLEFIVTLKTQLEPIRTHTRMKNAKQSHMRKDLSTDSLSVFMETKRVMV